MLSFHYTIVTTREFDGQPVAHTSCDNKCDNGTEAARKVAEADHGWLEAVSWAREDNGCGCVEHVEPDEVRTVREASKENNGPRKILN